MEALQNTLKHKRNSMSLDEVIIQIRVEDQNRVRKRSEVAKELLSKASLVEDPISQTMTPQRVKKT